MSCYEWETAEIKLPTTAVAPLKRILRDHLNTMHSNVYDCALRLHRPIAHLHPAEYRNHLESAPSDLQTENDAETAARHLLRYKSHGLAVRRPTHSDVDNWAPRVTGRITRFPVMDLQGCEVATVSVHGQDLSWHVEENNHAVEHAHEAALAVVLFKELNRINWTADTGGYGVGNNEYHSDSSFVGGGGNYKTFAYGPLGETNGMLQLQN